MYFTTFCPTFVPHLRTRTTPGGGEEGTGRTLFEIRLQREAFLSCPEIYEVRVHDGRP